VRGSEAAGMGKCVDGCMDAWVNDSIVTNCEMELSGIE